MGGRLRVVRGAWCLVLGAWCVVRGAWARVVHGSPPGKRKRQALAVSALQDQETSPLQLGAADNERRQAVTGCRQPRRLRRLPFHDRVGVEDLPHAVRQQQSTR